jgi:hypothetical protein
MKGSFTITTIGRSIGIFDPGFKELIEVRGKERDEKAGKTRRQAKAEVPDSKPIKALETIERKGGRQLGPDEKESHRQVQPRPLRRGVKERVANRLWWKKRNQGKKRRPRKRNWSARENPLKLKTREDREKTEDSRLVGR